MGMHLKYSRKFQLLKYFLCKPDKTDASMNDHAQATKEHCSKPIPIATCHNKQIKIKARSALSTFE